METCAAQAQVLQQMQSGKQLAQAEESVSRAKALTYQRDVFYFYDTDTAALTALNALAHGTAVLPDCFATYGVVHVNHWIEKRHGYFYLKDGDLAGVILNIHDQSYPIEVGYLWPLIPIAQCAGTIAFKTYFYFVYVYLFFIVGNDVRELPPDIFVAVPQGNWAKLWAYLLGHAQNQQMAQMPLHQNWPNMFRLARNIYCHEGIADGGSIRQLAAQLIAYFQTTGALKRVFNRVLSFYGSDQAM
jgi:hypothetical protein